MTNPIIIDVPHESIFNQPDDYESVIYTIDKSECVLFNHIESRKSWDDYQVSLTCSSFYQNGIDISISIEDGLFLGAIRNSKYYVIDRIKHIALMTAHRSKSATHLSVSDITTITVNIQEGLLVFDESIIIRHENFMVVFDDTTAIYKYPVYAQFIVYILRNLVKNDNFKIIL